MRSRQTLPAQLPRLSFLQDGVVSREQALAHGLGAHALDRLVGDQHWRALGRFRDLWRDNGAVADGRLTLRYGAYDLYQRPWEIAAQVGRCCVLEGGTVR